jgi:flagellar M-ring protein FliF
MDFLNRAYAHLAELIRSMTPGARAAAALLAIVSAVSVAYLFKEQVSGTDAYLMGSEPFSAAQLRDMEAAFGKAGLEGYQLEGARIKVPRGQQSKYMAALADANALPVDFGDYLQKAVAVNNFLTSRPQQEAAMRVANGRELQNIINQMSGIEKSAVHIDEQTHREGFAQQRVIAASVGVIPKHGQPLDENRVRGIRHLVAGWVAGLKPEAVSVVDLSTGLPYPAAGAPDKSGSVGEYTDLKRHHEREFQQKISHVLAYIPGVLVTTSVELDPEISNEQTSIEYPAGSSESDRRETPPTKTSDDAPPPQRPDAATPTLKQPGGLINGLLTRAAESASTPPTQAIPSTQRHVVREGRTPKRVAVSVAVPAGYYEKIWRQMNPAIAGRPAVRPDPLALAEIQAAEKRKIEELVAPLLPARDSADASAQVAVSAFHQFSEPAPRDPDTFDIATTWAARHANTLGLTGLALVGLIVLRSIVKAIPPAVPQSRLAAELSAPLSPAGDEFGGDVAHETPRARLRRRTAVVPSLRDDLADVVREDPDAAVSILRNWIGNSG